MQVISSLVSPFFSVKKLQYSKKIEETIAIAEPTERLNKKELRLWSQELKLQNYFHSNSIKQHSRPYQPHRSKEASVTPPQQGFQGPHD